MPVRGRPRLISSKPNMTKLYVDDLREVVKLSAAENKTMSDLIRELVHEAFRYRRLHAFAQDEGESQLRKLYQSAVQTGMETSLQPVFEQFAQMQQMLDTLMAQNAAVVPGNGARRDDRFSQALFALAAQLLRRLLVTENVAKVLMTVGMQRDQLGAEEIQTQLAIPEETAYAEAQQFMQKLLADYRLVKTENRPSET